MLVISTPAPHYARRSLSNTAAGMGKKVRFKSQQATVMKQTYPTCCGLLAFI